MWWGNANIEVAGEKCLDLGNSSSDNINNNIKNNKNKISCLYFQLN